MMQEMTAEAFEKMFPIVETEGISLESRFMKHKPRNAIEQRIKTHIRLAKERKIPNFRIPIVDPSFADGKKTIIYEQGRKPAVGECAIFWDKVFKEFYPEKNSRLITPIEYDIHMGQLINTLVEKEKYEVSNAWRTVCIDSVLIGHYRDSVRSSNDFENTGMRPLDRWYDLANTRKIIKNKKDHYYHASASYRRFGKNTPIAMMEFLELPNYCYQNDVGLMRMDV